MALELSGDDPGDDPGIDPGDDAPVDPGDDPGDDLPPSEAARARRRDHDAAAASRAGMRTGLAKQFKQILDTQVRRAREAGPRGARSGTRDGDGARDDADATEPPPRKRGHRGHRGAPPE